MKISAAILSRPSDPLLKDCIHKCRQWADEVVVGSCGSFIGNPDTKIHFPKDTIDAYGFSYVRNRIKNQCLGDWIVTIDTDENLINSREELVQAIQSAEDESRLGINAKVHTDGIPDEPIYRIFMNIPEISWSGIVHEEPFIHGEHLTNYSYDSDLIFEHFGPLLLSQKKIREEGQRLYSELTMRAIDFPGLRGTINPHWFNEVEREPEKWTRLRREYWSNRGVTTLHGTGMSPYATHLPILSDLTKRFTSPKLNAVEFGSGVYSTPFLSAATSLRSYEANPDWVPLMDQFGTKYSKDYSDVDLTGCNLLLIDGFTESRRAQVERAADIVPFIVCHDTETCNDYYGYRQCLPNFKYKYTDMRLLPWTTVVSNMHNLSFLGGGICEYVPVHEVI